MPDIHPIRQAEVSRLHETLPLRSKALHRWRYTCQRNDELLYLVAWETPQQGSPVALGHAVLVWDSANDYEADQLARKIGCPIVNDLLVASERRSQGIGTTLLAACEAAARERGHTRLALGVGVKNAHARALYDRLGYRDAGLGECLVGGNMTDAQGQERTWEDAVTYLVKRLDAPPDEEKAVETTPGQAVYDAVADWYDMRIQGDELVHRLTLPTLLDLADANTLAGLDVCDLACGQGAVTRILAGYGAHMIGVDIAQGLLARAREAEATEPLGITYAYDDISRATTLPTTAFDGALCHLALMDVSDLGGVAQTVARILRPGGWFVFVVTHPCYQTPDATWLEQDDDGLVKRLVGGYFDVGFWRPTTQGSATSVRERVGAHHRTLSMYLNTFSAVGLTFMSMQEPPISVRVFDQLVKNHPTEARRLLASGGMEVPIVLAARFEKR